MRGGAAGVRGRYAREAPRYDLRWGVYLEATISHTLAAITLPEGGRLLDVGCGTGLLLTRWLDSRPDTGAVGVDMSPEMLAVAQTRLARVAHLVHADAHDLPIQTGTVDTVVCSSVMHHWRQPHLALNEIRRVLRPGGTLTLTAWDRGHLPTRLKDTLLRFTDRSHYRAYDPSQCIRLLRDAGLAPDAITRYIAGWSWGLMTIRATARQEP